MASTPLVQPVTAPAQGMPGPQQGSWTYETYAAIPEDGNRYEVVDGVLYTTPAPNFGHQGVAGEIFAFLREYARQTGTGKAMIAPADVELAPGIVVQPDVFFVQAAARAGPLVTRLIGPPDLVVEVASPSTATYDRSTKLNAYARAGVPEYWIVDPNAKTVELRVLEGEEYRSEGLFSGGAQLPSAIVPGLAATVEEFFS